ncbi:helix-turn-helix transcriptional regulator [Candidatus Neomarinimicrobiota bacterium]
MAEISQIRRILRIMQLLSAGHRISTDDLQHRFEGVSMRTLQRDMSTIRSAGIPLQIDKGLGNQNYYTLDRRALSFIPSFIKYDEYLAALVLKANLGIFSETNFQSEIDALLEKLEQLVPDDVYDVLTDMNVYDNFTVGEYDYSGLDLQFGDIFNAIIGKRSCRVAYQGLGSPYAKKFEIVPVKIFQYNGALYLAGFIHKYDKFITLNFSRIQKIDVSENSNTEIPRFDVDQFRKGMFGLFQDENIEHVILHFDRDAAPHIIGRIWHPTQIITGTDDHGQKLEMDVGISPELISWIMSWVPMVNVIKPDDLVRKVRNTLVEGLEMVDAIE